MLSIPSSPPTSNITRRKALVVGATDMIGGFLVNELLASPLYNEIHVLPRRSLGHPNAKLRETIAEFDHLENATPTVDDVFCCLGTAVNQAASHAAFRRVAHDYVEAVARCARDHSSQRFLMVSSIGADATSENFYLRVKGKAESSVTACDYPELHIFRPSLLLGARPENRPAERLGRFFMRLTGPLLLFGLRQYRAVPAKRVAQAMANAAVTSTPGRHVHLFDDIVRLAGQ